MTLRATIEIVPFGAEGAKRELFRFDISNCGLVPPNLFVRGVHIYSVDVYGEDGKLVDTMEGIHHVRKLGACELVRKVLAEYQDKGNSEEDKQKA